MAGRAVQGKIARVSEKPFNDRKTGEEIFLYSFQLEGSNEWFRTGQTPIPAGVGQDVKFTAVGANVDRGSMQVVQSQAAQGAAIALQLGGHTPQPAARAYRGSGGVGTSDKDSYWKEKEARDIEKDARFQKVTEPRMALSVAVEAAATLVSTAIAKDAISFGSAAKAKKLDLLCAYTKEVALDLANFISDAPNQLGQFKASSGTSSTQESNEEIQE